MTPTPPDIADLRPWLDARFDRAGGPGGQNVNKVNTRVSLVFDFENCPVISPWQRDRIRSRLATRLAADGRLRVVRQSERSQLANREAAEEFLLDLLVQAWRREKPRRPSKPTRASKLRRLTDKRRRGETKRQRRAGGD